jgi:hypothetical protein
MCRCGAPQCASLADNPEARCAHDFPIYLQQAEVKETLDYGAGNSRAK